MILDAPLRLTRVVRFLTHPSHVNRALQSLTLTSKEMRSIALQVYYGNAVMLEPVFRSRKLDPRYELSSCLLYLAFSLDRSSLCISDYSRAN
jgi:hypothetical protein